MKTKNIIKMKYLILLMMLAALSVHGVVQAASYSRSSLYTGWIRPGDRLLYRQYFNNIGYPNIIQSQDIYYRGNRSTRISTIQATELGNNVYAAAYVISGGIGSSNVTIRLTSTVRGYGYYYMLDIWGR